MNILELSNEFKKLEEKIKEYKENNQDVTELLKDKISLLKKCYEKISEAIKSGKAEKIVPNFAKELAFLNNIKSIKEELKEDFFDIEQEINNIHNEMREHGFGWILDNLPEKAVQEENKN